VTTSLRLSGLFAALIALSPAVSADTPTNPWVVFEGSHGPGKGKHIVLVSGDEEYRSEEALPQLAKILARHHGFQCTVLFAIDKDGTINPNRGDNIPGLEALSTADLLIIFTRFRNLPDEQMKHIDDYLRAGKPVIGLRTATHAFAIPKGRTYARYGNDSNEKGWEGGFGRQVLGEKWISHHGSHGKQGTRGIIAPGAADHPILRGIKDGDIFGTTDVYGVRVPLPGDSMPLVLGQVTESLDPASKAVVGKVNDPMMPVAWTKTYSVEGGKRGRVFTTTMGASQDLLSEGTRRMLVNACYWAMGMEDKIPEKPEYRLVLDGLTDPSRKIEVIKVVREITNLGLKESKELVEAAPSTIKASIAKDEGDALKKKLQEAGAKVSLKSKVEIVGTWKPLPFRGDGFVKGVKPADLAIEK
jgi:ribosomal protein L7/L12